MSTALPPDGDFLTPAEPDAETLLKKPIDPPVRLADALRVWAAVAEDIIAAGEVAMCGGRFDLLLQPVMTPDRRLITRKQIEGCTDNIRLKLEQAKPPVAWPITDQAGMQALRALMDRELRAMKILFPDGAPPPNPLRRHDRLISIFIAGMDRFFRELADAGTAEAVVAPLAGSVSASVRDALATPARQDDKLVPEPEQESEAADTADVLHETHTHDQETGAAEAATREARVATARDGRQPAAALNAAPAREEKNVAGVRIVLQEPGGPAGKEFSMLFPLYRTTGATPKPVTKEVLNAEWSATALELRRVIRGGLEPKGGLLPRGFAPARNRPNLDLAGFVTDGARHIALATDNGPIVTFEALAALHGKFRHMIMLLARSSARLQNKGGRPAWDASHQIMKRRDDRLKELEEEMFRKIYADLGEQPLPATAEDADLEPAADSAGSDAACTAPSGDANPVPPKPAPVAALPARTDRLATRIAGAGLLQDLGAARPSASAPGDPGLVQLNELFAEAFGPPDAPHAPIEEPRWRTIIDLSLESLEPRLEQYAVLIEDTSERQRMRDFSLRTAAAFRERMTSLDMPVAYADVRAAAFELRAPVVMERRSGRFPSKAAGYSFSELLQRLMRVGILTVHAGSAPKTVFTAADMNRALDEIVDVAIDDITLAGDDKIAGDALDELDRWDAQLQDIRGWEDFDALARRRLGGVDRFDERTGNRLWSFSRDKRRELAHDLLVLHGWIDIACRFGGASAMRDELAAIASRKPRTVLMAQVSGFADAMITRLSDGSREHRVLLGAMRNFRLQTGRHARSIEDLHSLETVICDAVEQEKATRPEKARSKAIAKTVFDAVRVFVASNYDLPRAGARVETAELPLDDSLVADLPPEDDAAWSGVAALTDGDLPRHNKIADAVPERIGRACGITEDQLARFVQPATIVFRGRVKAAKAACVPIDAASFRLLLCRLGGAAGDVVFDRDVIGPHEEALLPDAEREIKAAFHDAVLAWRAGVLAKIGVAPLPPLAADEPDAQDPPHDNAPVTEPPARRSVPPPSPAIHDVPSAPTGPQRVVTSNRTESARVEAMERDAEADPVRMHQRLVRDARAADTALRLTRERAERAAGTPDAIAVAEWQVRVHAAIQLLLNLANNPPPPSDHATD